MLHVAVEAPEKIKETVVMKYGREVAVQPFRSQSAEWEWVDDTPSANGTDFYYPRVLLEDGETAWGSPVWITAADESTR